MQRTSEVLLGNESPAGPVKSKSVVGGSKVQSFVSNLDQTISGISFRLVTVLRFGCSL